MFHRKRSRVQRLCRSLHTRNNCQLNRPKYSSIFALCGEDKSHYKPCPQATPPWHRRGSALAREHLGYVIMALFATARGFHLNGCFQGWVGITCQHCRVMQRDCVAMYAAKVSISFFSLTHLKSPYALRHGPR